MKREKRPACGLRRKSESGLTGQGVLLLVIGGAIVFFVVWLGWNYTKSTEEEARAYADHVVQRLLFAHDAGYLDANLSARARPGYP